MRDVKAMNTTWLRRLLLIALVVCTIIPFAWTFVVSLKYPRDILGARLFSSPTLLNYREIFGRGNKFSALFRNSFVVALGATISCLFIGIPAAYSLSRWRFPWQIDKAMISSLIILRMIYPVALAIPYYLFMRKAGLYDTIPGLIMVYTAMNIPFAVLLLKSFLDDFPMDLEDAARVDGCSILGVLLRIVVPLVAPGLAAASIIVFIFSWNEYLFASVLTASTEAMTVPIGLAGFVQENIILWGPMSAAAVAFSIPVFVFVFLAQDYLIKGFTLKGSLKG